MNILSFIGDIFKPAADLVDNVHTSEEEKLTLRNALAKIEADVTVKSLELEGKVLELQGKLAEAATKQAVAEATSESWLVRNYRAIIITSMFVLIMCQSFGLLKMELPEVFWQIFAASFGVMSVAPSIAKASNGILKNVIDAVIKKK
jgi:hypothetical protein